MLTWNTDRPPHFCLCVNRIMYRLYEWKYFQFQFHVLVQVFQSMSWAYLQCKGSHCPPIRIINCQWALRCKAAPVTPASSTGASPSCSLISIFLFFFSSYWWWLCSALCFVCPDVFCYTPFLYHVSLFFSSFHLHSTSSQYFLCSHRPHDSWTLFWIGSVILTALKQNLVLLQLWCFLPRILWAENYSPFSTESRCTLHTFYLRWI